MTVSIIDDDLQKHVLCEKHRVGSLRYFGHHKYPVPSTLSFFSEHNKYLSHTFEVPHGPEQRAIVRRSRERVHGVDLVVTRHPHDAKHLRRAVPSTRAARRRGLLQASC